MGHTEIVEPSRKTSLFGEYEVVVLGGGPAGIAAALAAGAAAARRSLSSATASSAAPARPAGLSTFCGLHAVVHGKHEQVVHGVADDILDRLAAMDGLNKPHLTVRDQIHAQAYDISAFKIAADELMAEAKVKVLFHAFAVGVVMAADDDDRRGARRDQVGTLRGARPDLHRRLGRRRPRRLGRCAVRGRRRRGQHALPVDHVPDQRRRSGQGRPRLGADPDADGRGRKAGRTFPRKKPIVRPQRNPIEWRANLTQIKNPDGSAVSGIDARQLSYGEVEGPSAMLGRVPVHPERDAGFRQRLHRRDRAADRHPRDASHRRRVSVLTERDILELRAISTTPSASTAGRSRRTSKAT